MVHIYALEDADGLDSSLEITQLLQTEAEADKTGDYDQLHGKVKELVEEGKEINMDEVTSSEESNEETASDEVEEAPPEEVKDDEATEEVDDMTDEAIEGTQKQQPDGKIQSAVTESLRDEYYTRMALEAISLYDVKSAAMAGGRLLADLATVMYELGLKYSPAIWAGVKKTSIYLFTKTAKVILKSIVKTTDYIRRHQASFTKLNKDIVKLHGELDALIESSKAENANGLELISKSSSDEKLISWMSVNGQPNAVLAAGEMNMFMENLIKQIDSHVSNDLKAVKRLIDLSDNVLSGNPVSLLSVQPFSGRFLKRRVEGHLKNPELVDSYVYGVSLPDQVLFVSNLPKSDLKTMDEITEAYHEAGVFLAADNKTLITAEKVDYMDIGQLQRYLDMLENICSHANAHIEFYRRIAKQGEALKFSYRHYYQKLTQTDKEASIREELIEYVYLKQSFVNRVYLPAAMDIHDYVAAYLVRAVRFARENLKQFKVVQKESTV